MKHLMILVEVCVVCLAIALIIAISSAVVSSADERKEFLEACSADHKVYECALAWKTGTFKK